MSELIALRARFARRPLLLMPSAAQSLVAHLAASDPRGLEREGRLEAMLRKIGLGRRADGGAASDRGAGEDGARQSDTAPSGPVAYAPLWAEQRYGDPQDTGFGWSLFSGVAMMEVTTALSDRGEYFCGTFYHGYDTLMAAVREASADERVKGIFMRWMCPGGVVAGGIASLADFMRKIRASAGGKPLHMYCDMACSAAYWLASQGDFLSAPRVGLVGSIGAVIVHEDHTEWLRKTGIAVEAIQFGAKKTDGAWWKALTPEARADLQAEIDQCGEDFIADVVKGRPRLTAEALLGTEAGVFMGFHADPARSGLALGLIDATESEEEAFDRLIARISAPVATVTTSTAASADQQGGAKASVRTPKAEKEAERMLKNAKSGRKPAATTETAPAEDTAATSQTEAAADTEEDCPTCEGTGEVDGEPCPDCGGEGDDGDEPKPAEASEPTAAADAPGLQREAGLIAASAEGKANPAQALAAIEAGLTYEQFKTMSSAPTGANRPSALRAAMQQVRALGPDTATGRAASLGEMLVADAKARKQGGANGGR